MKLMILLCNDGLFPNLLFSRSFLWILQQYLFCIQFFYYYQKSIACKLYCPPHLKSLAWNPSSVTFCSWFCPGQFHHLWGIQFWKFLEHTRFSKRNLFFFFQVVQLSVISLSDTLNICDPPTHTHTHAHACSRTECIPMDSTTTHHGSPTEQNF